MKTIIRIYGAIAAFAVAAAWVRFGWMHALLMAASILIGYMFGRTMNWIREAEEESENAKEDAK